MALPAVIEPCLPSPGEQPPTGPGWVHEIEHDGYRLMARRDALSVGIKLLTRNGHDWASRYPLIVRAVNKLKVRSCLIDGEAVCCNDRGVSSFEKLRHRSHDPEVFLVAFDLLELDGNDLRREPLEVRKQTLASLLRSSLPGVQFNAHLVHPGDLVFAHACKMGLEGIVSDGDLKDGAADQPGPTTSWLELRAGRGPAGQNCHFGSNEQNVGE
jgi:bifunctional non-homologous end joining protein LigD